MSDVEGSQNMSMNNSNLVEEKLIGNYIIRNTIGQGSYGKVKMGIHLQTQEKVALKILEKDKIIELKDKLNLKNEIQVLKSIKHNNITQLYEIIENEEKIFIIMEYAENGDLFDYISKNKRLSETESNIYFQQIISILEYLHKLRIVHRDIKPENILLDYKNTIKITDFGLSRNYPDNLLLSSACGTPSYAPPEMLDGDEYHGLFSDIWSAGIVLFAMVCGYLPFEDSDENLLHKSIIKGDIQFPYYLSENLKDLLKNILNRDPTQRYDLELIKAHNWFNLNNVDLRNFGFNINDYILPIDETILQEVEILYEEDKELIKIFLLNDEFNELTAAYFILVKKIIREGGQSISDFNSEEFLQYINNHKNLKLVGKSLFINNNRSLLKRKSTLQCFTNVSFLEDKINDLETDINLNSNKDDKSSISQEKVMLNTKIKISKKEELNEEKEIPHINGRKTVFKRTDQFRKSFFSKVRNISFINSGDKNQSLHEIFQRFSIQSKFEKSRFNNNLQNKEIINSSMRNLSQDCKYSSNYKDVNTSEKLSFNTYENIKNNTLDTTTRREYKDLFTLNSEEKILKDKIYVKTNGYKNNSRVNIHKNVSNFSHKNRLINTKFNTKNLKSEDLSKKPKISQKYLNYLSERNIKNKIVHNRVISLPNLEKKNVVNFSQDKRKNQESKSNKIINISKLHFITSINTNNNRKNQFDSENNQINFSSKKEKNSSLIKIKKITIQSPNKTKSMILSPTKKQSLEKSMKVSPSKRDEIIKAAKISKSSYKFFIGAIDLSCCFAIDPDTLLLKLKIILKKNIIIYQNSLSKITCSKKSLKFLIDIKLLKDSTVSYLNMKMLKGSIIDYNFVVSKILKEIKIFK